ncbi:hypothetical protein ACRN94_07400 [Shewanella baltica]|uniref:hypothetical protein n=1 Tax=Shewanella baltica TaxID=62322 RepID=UPI003D7C0DE6
MTETGEILGELRRSRKKHDRLLRYVHLYAGQNKLDPKNVGLFVFPNGHVIQDRYPTKMAEAEFKRIAEMYNEDV